ncbi:hypothetical protein DL240_02775 [Lujinxingia litoralis]|uniref:Uncharacterized protein n=1 Tax=Lujinxingia litoralis TaxID=2211119 RepID=A0A328CCY2_9DELT|nr:hypothetical protein [Lujinxingia litoralis]RAL25151.1 hypothetical protein DL240_02775 [Lujinxingia litoralis]
MSNITLADVKIVLSGDLSPLNPEDVKWDLIARGAYVLTSVTKTTGALVAGAGARQALLDRAEKYGVPVLDLNGLRALLDGATVAEALAGPATSANTSADASILAGLRIAIAGRITGFTKASLSGQLQALGAQTQSKPSPHVDLLIVGENPSADGVAAMDAGVPFLRKPALDALLTGAPLSDFVAPAGPAVDDPVARIKELLEEARPEMVALSTGEPWDDELTLTVHPDGRVVAELRHLGGTPLHDHVREVLQRRSWPKVQTSTSLTSPISFT